MGLHFDKKPSKEVRTPIIMEKDKIMDKTADRLETRAIIPAPTAVGAAVARGEGDLVHLAHPGTPAYDEVLKSIAGDMVEVEVLPGIDFLDHNSVMRRGTIPKRDPDRFFAPHNIAHAFAANKLVTIIGAAPEGTKPGNAAVSAPSTKEEAQTGAFVSPEAPSNSMTDGEERASVEEKGKGRKKKE